MSVAAATNCRTCPHGTVEEWPVSNRGVCRLARMTWSWVWIGPDLGWLVRHHVPTCIPTTCGWIEEAVWGDEEPATPNWCPRLRQPPLPGLE